VENILEIEKERIEIEKKDLQISRAQFAFQQLQKY
jgi:hypothetical protein